MPFIEQNNPNIILDFKDNELDYLTKNIPVRFSIGDIDLFGPAEDPYFPVSVADFAPRGLVCIRVLETHHRAALDVNDGHGATILFQREFDSVVICFPLESIAMRVDYGHLLRSWVNFAIKVRKTIFLKFPEEIDNIWWDYDTSIDDWPFNLLVQRMTHPSWFERGWNRCFGEING